MLTPNGARRARRFVFEDYEWASALVARARATGTPRKLTTFPLMVTADSAWTQAQYTLMKYDWSDLLL